MTVTVAERCKTSPLDSVQARAGRFVTGRYMRTDSIRDIMSSLNWQTLEYRRDYTDLVTCHRIIHNKLMVPTQNVFVPHTSNTRSKTQPFQNIVCYVDAARNTYFPRTISRWNKLPLDVSQLVDENAFKRAAAACYPYD